MNRRTHKQSIPARILLVGDTSRLHSRRAVMLSTHGYEVESILSAAEAGRTWRVNRPDLVLLALTHAADETFALWRSIRKSDPEQRMSFLVSDSQYLCPVFLNGNQVLQGEGPEDIVARVRELLGEV